MNNFEKVSQSAANDSHVAQMVAKAIRELPDEYELLLKGTVVGEFLRRRLGQPGNWTRFEIVADRSDSGIAFRIRGRRRDDLISLYYDTVEDFLADKPRCVYGSLDEEGVASVGLMESDGRWIKAS